MEGSDLRNLATSPGPSPGPRRRFSFWFGISLIGLSFCIYLAYPVVPFLPISAWGKGGVAVGMSIVSWGIFFAGSILAGKEGLASLKRRFARRREQ